MQKIALEEFDQKFMAILNKYYKHNIQKSEQDLFQQYHKHKPTKQFFTLLENEFQVSGARVQKLVNGWLHKNSQQWPVELLDQIQDLIPIIFNKYLNSKIKKQQLIELVTDQIIQKLDLHNVQYKLMDFNYIKRLIYGKCQQQLKNVENQNHESSSDFQVKYVK